MNVKVGCCNICVPGGGVFAAEMIKMAGLDGMAIDLGYESEGFPLMSQTLIDLYKEAAKKNGISYSNIGCSCYDFIPFAPEIGTNEFELSVCCIKAAIHAADELDARIIMIPNFGVSKINSAEDFERTVSMFQLACDLASKRNIVVALESALPPEAQISLVNKVNRSNFGIYYDSQNFLFNSGLDQLEVLKTLYPYIVPVIHVKDGTATSLSSRLLGEGDSNYYGIINFLKEKEFEGWIINENYYNKPPLRQIGTDAFEVFMKDSAILKESVK